MLKSQNLQQFINIMLGLNSENKIQAVKIILAMFREGNAADTNYYQKPEKIQATVDQIFNKIDTTNEYLKALVQIEQSGPYSIFSYIMNMDYSDILIHDGGIHFSNSGNNVERFYVPEDLKKIYRIFMQHFIENIMFVTAQKFDTANSIMDAELGIFRFNLIHNSLAVSGFPILVIRKQTIVKGFNMDPKEYLKSIDATSNQAGYINNFAMEGNTVIFGVTGSGKTTFAKYMGNYRLQDKRNLCTIEDTRELNIPVPIALITNAHKNIKSLFTATLRQNPSHVIIGETRTDEIVDILEAALTVNVMTTIHANSFLRAIERILFMSTSRGIPLSDMRSLINSAVDCFIFMDDRKLREMWVKKKTITSNVYEAYEMVK